MGSACGARGCFCRFSPRIVFLLVCLVADRIGCGNIGRGGSQSEYGARAGISDYAGLSAEAAVELD